MPIYQRLVDFDSMFQTLRTPPVIVNDLVTATEEDKERISELISTRYNGDLLSVIPSCRCGEVKGEHRIGYFCEKCHSIVRSIIDEDIEPILWFRAPRGVAKLMNPEIWNMLKKRFSKSNFNVIQWLCDTTYRPSTTRQPKAIYELNELGIKRGWNEFVNNFDSVMELLFSMKDFRCKPGEPDYLRELLKDHRDLIFCNQLPLPNRSLLIIEKTNVGRYVTDTVLEAINAIWIIVGIDTDQAETKQFMRENRTVKACAKMADFYDKYIHTEFSQKRGVYRKHVFGTRTHFSFRAVVTSLTDPHEHNEIHVPWGVGVTAFRPHLINKLMSKRGFSHNSAVGFLNSHVECFHPFIKELFDELLAETEGKGLACITQRN